MVVGWNFGNFNYYKCHSDFELGFLTSGTEFRESGLTSAL